MFKNKILYSRAFLRNKEEASQVIIYPENRSVSLKGKIRERSELSNIPNRKFLSLNEPSTVSR